MPSINTLVDDIMATVDTGKTPDSKNLAALLKDVSNAIVKQMEPTKRQRDEYLRMSNVGKGDRQVYYDVNGNDTAEVLTPDTRLKFLFGDLIEALMLYLAKEAGHDVTDEQAEVTINGISGHIDAKIDGALVDVKSASPFSFEKFSDGTLKDKDTFGYIAQVSAYAHATEAKEAGFLVMDKVSAKLTYMDVPQEDRIDPVARIDHMKEVVASDTPPPRCHEPVPDGKSGNMKLAVGCSYCKHKSKCWEDANDGKGLRLFLYSTGPRWLSVVENEPAVFEVDTTNA
jgi:hypothetical protein